MSAGRRRCMALILATLGACGTTEPAADRAANAGNEIPATAARVVPADEEATMTTSSFGLSGNDYWTDPWKNAAAVFERHVFDGDFGLFIDAPPRVDLGTHATIPMPLLYSAKKKDALKVGWPEAARLVVVDVGRRVVNVGDAVEPTETAPGSPGPVDLESEAPTSRTTVTDLMARGGIRDVGRYIATVIMGAQVSNRLALEVVRSPNGYDDPEVARFLAEQRAQPRPPAPPQPMAGDPYPSYRAMDRSPAMPAEPGIAVALERVVATNAGARAPLHAAFRLPVRKDDLVPPAVAGQPDYGTPRPTAIVPISMVIVGSTDVTQKVTSLRVPIFGAVDPSAESQLVTGHFALDLFTDRTIRSTAQTNFVYFFCAEVLSGPHAMAVVTPDMLSR